MVDERGDIYSLGVNEVRTEQLSFLCSCAMCHSEYSSNGALTVDKPLFRVSGLENESFALSDKVVSATQLPQIVPETTGT